MTEIEYDNLPERVKAIVNTYDDNENLYEECHRIKIELEHIGWTCDSEREFCKDCYGPNQMSVSIPTTTISHSIQDVS